MARRRGLTPEDRDLWTRVARTAEPLDPKRKGQAADLAAFADMIAPPAPAPTPPAPLPRFRVGQAAPLPAPKIARPVSPADQLSAAALRMDARTHRRMSKGKLHPEARLDLHGLTLSEAQPELLHFILRSHANGLRLVLVITGKGRGDHGPLPTRPGALRYQVPYWLHAAPLSAVVQQVSAAHFRHGGDGAYYVYLRRPKG